MSEMRHAKISTEISNYSDDIATEIKFISCRSLIDKYVHHVRFLTQFVLLRNRRNDISFCRLKNYRYVKRLKLKNRMVCPLNRAIKLMGITIYKQTVLDSISSRQIVAILFDYHTT